MKPKCKHAATKPVIIGGHKVYLGARWDISADTISRMDLILPLNGYVPKAKFGTILPIMECELQDRGGVPKGWGAFIKNVAKMVRSGSKVLAYCTGSHGRTGCFAASLIAFMEPQTKDPIAAIRERHCEEAVESLAQVKAIYAIKGITDIPDVYWDEFYVPPYVPPQKQSKDWDKDGDYVGHKKEVTNKTGEKRYTMPSDIADEDEWSRYMRQFMSPDGKMFD